LELICRLRFVVSTAAVTIGFAPISECVTALNGVLDDDHHADPADMRENRMDDTTFVDYNF
jgi:hypothetical protein